MSPAGMQKECVLHKHSLGAQLTQIHGMLACLLGLRLRVQLTQTHGVLAFLRLSVQ